MGYAGVDGMYLVNLNISVCLESGQPCSTVIPVFVNSLLPKEACDRGLDFINKGLNSFDVYSRKLLQKEFDLLHSLNACMAYLGEKIV